MIEFNSVRAINKAAKERRAFVKVKVALPGSGHTLLLISQAKSDSFGGLSVRSSGKWMDCAWGDVTTQGAEK